MLNWLASVLVTETAITEKEPILRHCVE